MRSDNIRGEKQRPKTIGLHLLFWVCVFTYNILENWSSVENKTALLEMYATKLPVQIMIAYVVNYILITRYLAKKKYAQFLILMLVTVYITCILYASYRAFYFEIKYPDYFRTKTNPSLFLYVDVIRFVMYATSFFTPAAIMAVVKLMRTQYDERAKIQLLEKEKLHVELGFLKSQLNPHFLFNTLNNLYMLTLKNSPQAPEVVAKLSDTLDYMLYRCQERTVPLKGEIQLIENYLVLEKLRLNEDVRVTFNHNGVTASENVAPLVMLSLVENAFKHGVNKTIGKSGVDIMLQLKDARLTFVVTNTRSALAQSGNTGIGLKNIRRQLELIYPDHHSLTIQETDITYTVTLNIDLTEKKHHDR